MAQATLRAAQANKTAAPIDPEQLRADLLRPFPRLTFRGLLIILAVVAVLGWSLSGVGPSETNRVTSIFDPFIATINLIGRMLPPEFEVDRVRNVEINLLGNTIAQFSITRSNIEIFGQTWQVGWLPIISATFETVQMAIIGTLGAVIFSVPVSLLAARNTSPHPIIYQSVRFVLNFMRSIPELIWAILFVAGVGFGAFAGVLALVFGSLGSLARIYAEAIEQIDPQQVLAVRATGASGVQAFVYAVIPQALPLLISYSIIFFESNVRHATILGLVGAGGLGGKLWEYTGLGDYQRLMGTIVVLVVAVTIIDRFSSWLRQRFI